MSPRQVSVIEDAAWLAETGESWDGALRRLGRSSEALENLLRRARRLDVLHALRSRRWAA